jgi:alpha/beta superfamily hydrolase
LTVIEDSTTWASTASQGDRVESAISDPSATRWPEAPSPGRLYESDERETRWRAWITATRLSLPTWSRHAPDRGTYCSTASGCWQIYSWDRVTEAHRQITDRPGGTFLSEISADGDELWWFRDTDGDEFGHWAREPFRPGDGAPATSEPVVAESATPGVPDGYPAGIALGTTIRAVGVSNDDGSAIWTSSGSGPFAAIYAHENDAELGALSADDTLLALQHSEHGDSRHPALRVLHTESRAVVGERHDAGRTLLGLEFSPLPQDQRLLVVHERRGRPELLLWDIATDSERELRIPLPGELVASFYPDGQALLLIHNHAGRSTLHRFDLATEQLHTLDTATGTISAARALADGRVSYHWSNAAHAPLVREIAAEGDDHAVWPPAADRPPAAAAMQDTWVDGPGGAIHVLISRPAAHPAGPAPTLFSLHGGPHMADDDRFHAMRSTWVEDGFTVVQLNYRGSSGYGSKWRDAIEGRPGLTEVEDLVAVHDWCLQTGLAEPTQCLIEGFSWGGYLALLAAGLHPLRWAGIIAGLPIADYLSAYAEEMEPLRAMDRSLFGGSPEDVPERYRASSPLTYVDAVRAPVMIAAGRNDPRCPMGQIENYLSALSRRGAECRVLFFEAGHGPPSVDLITRLMSGEVHFARQILAGELAASAGGSPAGGPDAATPEPPAAGT